MRMKKINSIPVRELKIGDGYGWREKIKINDHFYKIHDLVMNNPLLLWQHILSKENNVRVQKDVFKSLKEQIMKHHPDEYSANRKKWIKRVAYMNVNRKLNQQKNSDI